MKLKYLKPETTTTPLNLEHLMGTLTSDGTQASTDGDADEGDASTASAKFGDPLGLWADEEE